MLNSLQFSDFEYLRDNVVTVGLLGNTLHHCRIKDILDENQPSFKYVSNYPNVCISDDIPFPHEARCASDIDDLFLYAYDNGFKKFATILRRKGLSEAIRFAAQSNPEDITYVAHWIALRLKWVLDLMEREIYHKDILPLSGAGSISDIVPTQNWDRSLIRCIAWHPHYLRLAVATRDDRIHIYPVGSAGPLQRAPALRHAAQKSICCLSWKPYAGRRLAVACWYGILMWSVEAGAASNALSNAMLLKRKNHAPVTCVAWHPQGDLLASCSPTDSSIIIWDISRGDGVPLKRFGGGGVCFVRWSICGSRLFAASRRHIFRIWNAGVPTPWHADKWTVPNSRVTTACFGPNLTLLFTVDEDSQHRIFLLPLEDNIFDKKEANNIAKVAMPLIYLEKSGIDIHQIGKQICSMEWDSKGQYLAIIFQNSPLIALIKTSVDGLSQTVKTQSGYFIKGTCFETPQCINFYEADKSCLILTIGWSSGRLQHFPIDENGPKAIDITPSSSRSSSCTSLEF